MSKNRMCLDCEFCRSDSFCSLSAEAQAFYMHLQTEADKAGIVPNCIGVLRYLGFGMGALDELLEARFLLRVKGVFVIKHWWMHNTPTGLRWVKESKFGSVVDALEVDGFGAYRVKGGKEPP